MCTATCPGGGGGVDVCNGDALHMSLPCIVHNHGSNVSTGGQM